jgi:NAD(P)-dependent dehydrogenase (short-subunit alcohol dehydrogenase family)
MTTTDVAPGAHGGPDLAGQTVVLIGGSSGIGLETARHARAAGAAVVLTGRRPEPLREAAAAVQAVATAAFDARDPDAMEQFFDGLPGPIDHVLVTAGNPHYMTLADMDLTAARRALDGEFAMVLGVALHSRGKVRPGGSLLFMGGTGGRRPAVGLVITTTLTVALPALTANLALELAPTRVNLIAAGFVDTPLSATLLGDQLDARREQLRTTLPIGRVVGPGDVAALAVHLMANEALTGATYDIDGGQQLIAR